MRHITKGIKHAHTSKMPKRAKPIKRWNKVRDEKLCQLVMNAEGEINWADITEEMGDGLTKQQCFERWVKVLDPNLRKGEWTEEEDKQLIKGYKKYGKQWKKIVKELFTTRNDKQVRERWVNHHDPKIRRDDWTKEEDDYLSALETDDPKWVAMAKEVPFASNGTYRTGNQVKIRFHSLKFTYRDRKRTRTTSTSVTPKDSSDHSAEENDTVSEQGVPGASPPFGPSGGTSMPQFSSIIDGYGPLPLGEGFEQVMHQARCFEAMQGADSSRTSNSPPPNPSVDERPSQSSTDDDILSILDMLFQEPDHDDLFSDFSI